MRMRRQSAVITLIMWSVIMTLFVVLFFVLEDLDQWQENQLFRLISAVLLFIGGVAQIMLLSQDKVEPFDERTQRIQYRTSSVAVIGILLYVYALVMTLYISYEFEAGLPVAWLWFIAYTTIFIAFILHSALYLIFEHIGVRYED